MKNYLIKGALALIASVVMTSCHVDEDFTGSIVEEKVQAYEKIFEQEFGTIDPNQDWGFGEESVLARTRAAGLMNFTRGIRRSGSNANGNEWCKTYSNIPAPLTDEQIKRVRLYFQSNTFTEPNTVTFNTYFVQQVYKGGTNPGPNPEHPNSPEIYQAANGTSTIVGGNQMDYLTVGTDHVHVYNFNNADAGVYSNVKDGYTYKDNYIPWTEESAAAANKSWADAQIENFNNLKEHSDKIMLMEDTPTTCFGYWNSNNSNGHDDMYVCIDGATIDAWAATQSPAPGESVSGRFFVGFDFEQVFDVNAKNNDGSDAYFEYGGKQYNYLSQSTDKYAGTMERRTDQQLYIDGNAANGLNPTTIQDLLDDGYLPIYGRDLREWVNVSHLADHYYSDWIVAITPGETWGSSTSTDPIIPIENGDGEKIWTRTTKYYKNEVADAGRILCEDLGVVSASDIDFNDIVLDVYIYKKSYWVKVETSTNGVNFTEVSNVEDQSKATYGADIWALAGGGTIPVTITAGNKNYNLKNCFDPSLSDKTIVNTVVEPEEAYGNIYENFTTAKHLNTNLIEGVRNISDVDITVKYGGASSGFMTLKAYKGVAPHKLCVPLTTLWPRERVEINNAYTAFTMYVKKRDAQGNYIETTNGTTANGKNPPLIETRQNSVWQNPVTGAVYNNTVSYTPRHEQTDWVEIQIAEGPTTVESGGENGYKSGEPVLIRRRD